MLPFWISPSAPASASTWFCDHADDCVLRPGAGGMSARITGTPALPAASIAGDSATLSAGSTMIALTPWRTICWIAEICCSGVEAAMVAGMFVIRLPVTRPFALAFANCAFSPSSTCWL